MSDASSNAEQTNDEVPKNLLAKKFFDKLRKDGPKLDKLGQSFVRHFSQPAVDPLKEPSSHSEPQTKGDMYDDMDDTISGSRRLRQLRVEIMREFSDIPKDSDSNPGNEADKK